MKLAVANIIFNTVITKSEQVDLVLLIRTVKWSLIAKTWLLVFVQSFQL